MARFFKVFKSIIIVAIVCFLAFFGLKFAPVIGYLLKGELPLNLRDTQLNTYIQDLGTLLTLKQNKTGTISNTTKALFGITANSIEIDYEFEAYYGLNLEKAVVSTNFDRLSINPSASNTLDFKDKKIIIYLPKAELVSNSLKRVGNSRKQDFLKPISEENVHQIMQSLEKELINNYAINNENLNKAWKNGSNQVANLLEKFASESGLTGFSFEFKPLESLPVETP